MSFSLSSSLFLCPFRGEPVCARRVIELSAGHADLLDGLGVAARRAPTTRQPYPDETTAAVRQRVGDDAAAGCCVLGGGACQSPSVIEASSASKGCDDGLDRDSPRCDQLTAGTASRRGERACQVFFPTMNFSRRSCRSPSPRRAWQVVGSQDLGDLYYQHDEFLDHVEIIDLQHVDGTVVGHLIQ